MADIKVTYIDHMGDDLKVVNAARVSFDKESTWDVEARTTPDGTYILEYVNKLKPADAKLIQFLARGMTTTDFEEFVREVALTGYSAQTQDYGPDYTSLIKLLEKYRDTPEHWSPFAHPQASFRVSAPLFVARQLQKHTVGLAWNETSRRYVDSEPSFYVPEVWRKRADNVKQGSSDEAVEYIEWTDPQGHRWKGSPADVATVLERYQLSLYESLLSQGVCPEQARMVLPQSMMTEWYWSGTLYAFARVCKQRLDPHTQFETRRVAEQISAVMAEKFPVSWKALVG